MIVLIQILKVFVPRNFSQSRLLHRLLAAGLKTFVTPEANWLILRHFHIGSQILGFIAANSGVTIETTPLLPRNIDDLKDELFVKHDLNLFNFVIRLNNALKAEGKQLGHAEQPDFSMIRNPGLDLGALPRRWHNLIDLQSAIELFTPMYQLFLTDNDFWRASNSLQLDETIGLYIARLLSGPEHLVILNNKHPLVPMSTLRAGNRLVLHGLSSEMLHGLLMQRKDQTAHANRPSPLS